NLNTADINLNTADCGDSTGGSTNGVSPDCSADGVLCRTFIDEDNNEYIRDANLIVTASSQCIEFRRTDDTIGAQEKWYFIQSEANTCAPSALGCREYKGTNANQPKKLIIEPFDSEFRTKLNQINAPNPNPSWWWQGAGSLAPSSSQISTENSATGNSGDYSIGLSPNGLSVDFAIHSDALEYSINKNLTTPYGDYDFRGKQYEIRFVAKALNSGVKLGAAFMRYSGTGEEWFFRGASRSGSEPDMPIPQYWSEYKLGPLVWDELKPQHPYSIDIDFLGSGTFPSGGVLIDNFELIEISDKHYKIKSTVEKIDDRGLQPDVCYKPTVVGDASTEFNSCHEYKDERSNKYYVARFDKLFSADALSCIAVIDTHNSQSPYSSEYNTSNTGTGDEYFVDADEISYLRIKDTNKTDISSAGCTEIGLPTSTGGWQTVHRIIDPDNFQNDLCNVEGEGCEKFVSQGYGEQIFKDPGENICTWNEKDEEFQNSLGGPCSSTDVKECPKEQHSCTAYKPVSEDLSEGSASVLYKLQSQVDNNKNDCAEGQNTDIGCVEFYENYATSTIKWITTPNLLKGVTQTSKVLSVVQRRECSEWLTPSTYSEVDDERARTKRTVTYDLGRCQELSPNKQCQTWVDQTSDKYPEAYRNGLNYAPFDIGKYQERYGTSAPLKTLFNGAWDYSGYSIPDKNPIESLAQYKGDNSVLGTRLFSGRCDGSICTKDELVVDSGTPFTPDEHVDKFVVIMDQGPSGDAPKGEVRKIVSNTNNTLRILKTTPFSTEPDGALFHVVDGDQILCRAYPEKDSPFSRGSTPVPEKYIGLEEFTEVQLRNLSVCRETGENCDCSYKKVESTGEAFYFSRQTSKPFPEDARSITDHIGWQGYCVEEDKDSLDPNGKPACLAWYPVDVVQSSTNIFDNHPEAGYASVKPLYYCLEARSNKYGAEQSPIGSKRPISSGFTAFDIEYRSAKDNNYILDIGQKYPPNNPGINQRAALLNEFNIAQMYAHSRPGAGSTNLEVKPFHFKREGISSSNEIFFVANSCTLSGSGNSRTCDAGSLDIQPHSVDNNGWRGASGILTFPINKNSPISGLHEYDIEKIVLTPTNEHSYGDWPKASEPLVLQRDGFAKQKAGGGSSFDVGIGKDERWTSLWCTGEGCDFESEYTWDKFYPFMTDLVFEEDAE
ncbi:hypothetical protein HOC67_03540, partial [Candidatus Peregrinibacteria bacterium]|nr:hypothetical protein [Candidatus Peregrinibacteria bacterium]